ncbi:MAG: NAD(P)/FAD-dependent oxidoreductase [Acidimicrobiales bacterium]|nr:NAD(P)/FAD-dependent oxidoreductase [Acidimicrobiales bacterium]
MPKIAIIGSGFSGLGLGIQLKRQGIDTFTIFEKADEVGGTWRANTYPGAECDIPSALYSYSFENFDWPNKWSHQPVIKAYLEHCADEYHLRPHLRFAATVTEIRYDEDAGAWDVDVNGGASGSGSGSGTTERFDVVVSATGQLSRPRWPDIDGLDTFDGPVFHSAEWDHSVDVAGTRVASIGAGASAIQYVPQVAKTAEQVTIFQRTPNWIIPKNDRDYTEVEKALIRRSRLARNLRRFSIWLRADVLGFDLMKQTSRFRRFMEKYARKNLAEKVSDPDKVAELTPDFPMGAKRVLFSDDFYEAIEEFDVEVVADPIEKITPNAVVTSQSDGSVREHELDVIVVGTGFHTQDFLTPMRVVGPGGRSLEDEWRDGPEAYLGMSVSGFPNLFFMYGPNTNLGHNSIVLMIESQCRYLLSLFTQMASDSIQAVDVKPEVQQAYNDELAARLADSAWVLIEDSWYLQGGKVTNNWVGRTTEYRRRTNHAHLDDYHCTPMPLPR